MSEEYSIHHLPNGIRLHFMPTKKFKTISLGMFIHQDLTKEKAALNALLPAVLEQGCRPYPDYLTLQRALENLYGSELSTAIIKSGEKHILAFNFEAPHDRFVGSEGLLEAGLSLLGALTGDPLLDDDAGAFRSDYVNQEKNQLIKDIRALLNDKAAYAFERCLAEMCAAENFGVYRLGAIEDYEQIDPAALSRHYQSLISTAPIDLYVVGDLDPAAVTTAAASAFNFSGRPAAPAPAPPPAATALGSAPAEPRFIEEEMSVNQAKLVLGYRTGTGFSDELHCPLLVYSGILGGFPHSKLFMKVREEASLAYYIHTRLERHKGLMLIAAGINHTDYEQARAIIDEQLSDMAAGQISDSELDNTKSGLINQLLSRRDSPGQVISFHLDGLIGGRDYSIDELVDGIKATGREELCAVASRIRLDTAYLLKPRPGEEPGQPLPAN